MFYLLGLIEKVRLWFLRLLQTLIEGPWLSHDNSAWIETVYIVIVMNINKQANSNPAVYAVLFVLILLLSTS